LRVRLGAKVTGNFRKSVEREIKKYRGDHYLWHRHISGIELNPHQVAWMNEMDTVGDSHMLIGSRRIRKSFTVAAYFLEEAACLRYSEVNVHSPALEQSKRNLRYMTDMVMNSEILLAYIDSRLGEGLGKEHIEFMNRSQIQAKGQASSVDGLGATHQWLEEFDDMDWEPFLTRIYPTGSQIKDDHDYGRHQGCCRIITGTIKGIGNIYNIEHPTALGEKGARMRFNVLPKFNCFTPDTTVLTRSGLRRIDEIQIDDSVVVEGGLQRQVKQVHIHDYDDDLVVVTMAYGSGLPIRCTPNHKFLTKRGWVEASELKLGDEVVCNDEPIQTNGESLYDVDIELAYLTGLYLADGCLGVGSDGATQFVNFSFNKLDLEGIRKAKDAMTSSGLAFAENSNGTAHQIWTTTPYFGEHVEEICGRYSRGKSINPIVESWSDELKASFLKGYFNGDGCVVKNRHGNRTCISSKTVNKNIAIGISRLLIQLGVRATVNSGIAKESFIEGRSLPATRYWRVQTERIETIDDIGRAPIGKQGRKTGEVVKLQVEKYTGKVYDLGVDEIHSYTLGHANAVVSNCWHGVEMKIIPENDIYLFQGMSTPHQFARTYLVLYVESSAFYPDRWIRNCVDNDYAPIDVIIQQNIFYKAQGDVTVGIDCAGAGSGADSSNWSITFTEKIGNQVFWLYSEEWSANERPDVVLEGMKRLFAFFRPRAGFGDAFDTAFLYDLNRILYESSLTRIDVRRFENKAGGNGWDEWFIKPLRFTGPTKHLMHERMQKYIYACTFRYPAIVEDDSRYAVLDKLLKQFGNIKAERSGSGYNKYMMLNSLLGDDIVDSCIASIWAQEEIRTLVLPVGGSVPQMEFRERPGFTPLGPKFLNDYRKNAPGHDQSIFGFLKGD